MACLRGISKRVNLLQRRVYPTCAHLISDDRDQTKPSSNTMIRKAFAFNGANTLTSMFMERQCAAGPLGLGLSSCRFMSSTTTPPEWSDKVDGIDFVAPEVVPDQIVEAVTTTSQAVVPAVNEVAIAAADSAFPVAALQHLIDGVHSFTGLNWYVYTYSFSSSCFCFVCVLCKLFFFSFSFQVGFDSFDYCAHSWCYSSHSLESTQGHLQTQCQF